jgi:parallel beta-helix repeat protein
LEYEISDSFVQGESIGVTIQGNCSGKLSGNQIIDNDNTGIYIVKGTGKHEIIQNKISQSNYGIYFELLENEKQQTSLIKKNVCSRLVRGICITGEAAIIDVIGNKCLDNDKEGIYAWSADEVKLSDNICNDNGEQGIFLERIKKRATVENNVCHSNKKNGIYLVSSKTILKKNKLNKNGFHGISVAYGIMEAEENECTGNDGSGIYLDSCIDGYIKNNILRNNRFYGIARGENKIVSKIEDNEISGNLKGNIWQKEKEYGDFCLLLINKEYDKLDALGRKLRTEEIKDLNGKWVIRNFYDEMSGGWNFISAEYSEKIIDTMNEWIEEKPDSIIPRIVLSQLYVNVGWSHRGT